MKLQVLFFIFWLIFLLSSVKHGRYTGRAESNQELDAVLVDHTDNSQQPSQFSSIISSKYEGELNLVPFFEGLKKKYPQNLKFRTFRVVKFENETENETTTCNIYENEKLRKCTKDEKYERKSLVELILEKKLFFSRIRTHKGGISILKVGNTKRIVDTSESSVDSPPDSKSETQKKKPKIRDSLKPSDLTWIEISLPLVEHHDYPIEAFKQLFLHQKINRIPMTATELNRKDSFALNIRYFQEKYPDEFYFHPETFILPQDWDKLERATLTNSKFIAKPVFGDQGNGIRMINSSNIESVPKDGSYLVQNYISNPFLINGRKFTLRVYPLITSLDPLRIYLYNNGIVKFASKNYNFDMNSFGLNQDDVFIHITNQNQQRFSPSQESSRWNIEIFLNFLKSQGYNESQVWRNIQSIIVKAILSVHSKLLNASNTYAAYPKNCFQIFGIDIDLDSNLKPWLIESNINPFLEAKVAWERKEKLELLYRMFAMIGITNFNNTSFKSDIQTSVLQVFEKIKEEGKENLLFQSLSQDELDSIVDFEYENFVKGNFELIYPVPSTLELYQKFYNSQKKDIILKEWNKIRNYFLFKP